MANPAKVAEWRALAPLAAGSAVMFHFRCCNVLQNIGLLRGNQYIHCRRAMNTAFVVFGSNVSHGSSVRSRNSN